MAYTTLSNDTFQVIHMKYGSIYMTQHFSTTLFKSFTYGED